jgi:hypothetical protein
MSYADPPASIKQILEASPGGELVHARVDGVVGQYPKWSAPCSVARLCPSLPSKKIHFGRGHSESQTC